MTYAGINSYASLRSYAGCGLWTRVWPDNEIVKVHPVIPVICERLRRKQLAAPLLCPRVAGKLLVRDPP
jgi:hypothetical protein